MALPPISSTTSYCSTAGPRESRNTSGESSLYPCLDVLAARHGTIAGNFHLYHSSRAQHRVVRCCAWPFKANAVRLRRPKTHLQARETNFMRRLWSRIHGRRSSEEKMQTTCISVSADHRANGSVGPTRHKCGPWHLTSTRQQYPL